MLCLVTFDLKKAFNSDTIDIFLKCFWAYKISNDYI